MAHDPDGRRLVLIELNEISLDLVRDYTGRMDLPNWQKLLSGHVTTTLAEDDYELLEPWIQWPSVHTGLTAAEHGIFRLGDIVGTSHPQLFETLEARGWSVGAISPMNAENRLKHPTYFIPDPWTDTPSDGSWWSTRLSAAISQAVNDNAKSKLTVQSAMALVLALARFARPAHYGHFLRLAAGSRRAPWRRALVLDLLLNDLHQRWRSARRPNFSVLFLNAGAHIQHHYMFNIKGAHGTQDLHNPEWYVAADVDPFAEMLEVYDVILGDYLGPSADPVVIATGISQEPYPKIEFYWRLTDHQAFLQHFGFERFRVQPRMTRDFLVEFDSPEDAAAAAARLRQFAVKGSDEPLFGEVDERSSSVFATLTFPGDITDTTIVVLGGIEEPLKPFVTFVAIKNGMHQSRGYAYWSPSLERLAPPADAHVGSLNRSILQFFDAGTA